MRKTRKSINYRNGISLFEKYVAVMRDEWDKHVLNNGKIPTMRELIELGQVGSYHSTSKLCKAFTLNVAYPKSKKGYKH